MPDTKLNSASVVLPACGPTIERLQRVLDGELSFESLDGDPHTADCNACRERISAARHLIAELSTRTEPGASPNLADRIIAALHDERATHVRHRTYWLAGSITLAALAASLLIAWFAISKPLPADKDESPHRDLTKSLPESKPEPTPAPQPVRMGDEFAKVGEALRPITEPEFVAPSVVSALTDSFTLPAGPELEPTRKSLAELSDAALSGLEPVADTTQKAFSRLLRDIGAVGMSTRPKS